ncbi:MAG: Fic family protein [Dehalococcoidia bacterium]|jgi:hypothetical protein|nr:Fic family protein [Dehalococcoidia bacterium]
MDSRLFSASPCGRVIRTRTRYDAFVPSPLPPNLCWNEVVRESIEQAGASLNGFIQHVRERAGFADLLLCVDALHAARAEGATCTLAALFEAEAAGTPPQRDVRLGLNYVAAFEHARARLDELPLSLRLVREMHYVLADGVAEPRSTPGYFRTSQNWLGPAGCSLGEAALVPPPPGELRDLLYNWEQYLHTVDNTPAIARTAIAHYQLLALHPFLTLNVALGALAATFILQHTGVAGTPTALLGAFAARRSTEFIERLLDLARTGEWEKWLLFYACGLANAALGAGDVLHRLKDVTGTHDALLVRGRAEDSTRRAAELLREHPAMSLNVLADGLNLAPSDALEVVERLTALGIADWHPATGVVMAPAIIGALELKDKSPLDYGVFF